MFFSKNRRSYANLDAVRVQGNEAAEGRNKVPPPAMVQYAPRNPHRVEITRIADIIHSAFPSTPLSELATTSEIARAYGYDPEKFCPTCYRKFKRHATRRRIGDHRHYPIFAVCNPNGKNPSNVWEVATKAHYGNEHFAIFPEELVDMIVRFATEKGDYVLDPFAGRGTTGIVAASLGRRFVGIVGALRQMGHQVLNGHLAESGVGEAEAVLHPTEVYARDVAWIRECDALIAEISVPSHGVGYEIGFALGIGKPVLALHQQGRRVSKMITGNPHELLHVRSYNFVNETFRIIAAFLEKS